VFVAANMERPRGPFTVRGLNDISSHFDTMSNIPDDGYFEVHWPRAERRQFRKALAPRLETLVGKTVVFVWGLCVSRGRGLHYVGTSAPG
jgi:hypothetical protein